VTRTPHGSSPPCDVPGPPGSRLLVVEVLVPDTPGPDHSKMLEMEGVVPTSSTYFIVEATAV
jgi:hypothetical protein